MGVYTDADTACIRPLRQWPGIREDHWELKDITDPWLSISPHMFDLISQTASSSTPRRNETDEQESAPLSAVEKIRNRMDELKLDFWEPPALVVAVEFDYWGPRAKDSWTHWDYSRGMQIVQSTFMAQPGHPVLLDVLGRIMRDIQKGRATLGDEGKDEANPGKSGKLISEEKLLDILDFTGPGVFSDAVFRYLMARWGVQPGDLTQASGPVRVGDVLIYPLDSFTCWDAKYGEFKGEQKLVYHESVTMSFFVRLDEY
ncbi:hypothetical protein QFC22_005556 [Naganishia vaughanmartiniae]|uniref:Uncharacterized protein n=1 Tax=Naganishia vaughanmartiniae TaxID=1424756 RepID=A0ACC2WTP4_9TREE|nr:hypothetical protein QFC22_005556 [Naganishia vaughanmartiniae]